MLHPQILTKSNPSPEFSDAMLVEAFAEAAQQSANLYRWTPFLSNGTR